MEGNLMVRIAAVEVGKVDRQFIADDDLANRHIQNAPRRITPKPDKSPINEMKLSDGSLFLRSLRQGSRFLRHVEASDQLDIALKAAATESGQCGALCSIRVRERFPGRRELLPRLLLVTHAGGEKIRVSARSVTASLSKLEIGQAARLSHDNVPRRGRTRSR
jgi:hypothetical protein